MAKFTDSPFEKMMSQRPTSFQTGAAVGTVSCGRCSGCSYAMQRPCIGYCIKELMRDGSSHRKGVKPSRESEESK